MRLIIITQKVDINDDNLGFFHHWLERIVGKLELAYVVCLTRGEHSLPENTEVYSLGKERGYSKLRQFIRLQKFLFRNLNKTDGIFVHMCPIYAVACSPLVKLFGKRMVMFYAHGGVSFYLKLAEKLVDRIVTSSLAGCRIKSKKIKTIGQGIDTNLFKPKENSGAEKKNFRILSAGRISPVKDQKTLVRAIDILVNRKNVKSIEVKIIGNPIESYEKIYFKELKNLIKERNLGHYIEFLGGVPYAQMPEHYQAADVFINTSSTGSLDKTVLEAMASGCLVLNCNEAYKEILAEKHLFKKNDAENLAEKLLNLINSGKDESLREIVIKDHNLDNLAARIIDNFRE